MNSTRHHALWLLSPLPTHYKPPANLQSGIQGKSLLEGEEAEYYQRAWNGKCMPLAIREREWSLSGLDIRFPIPAPPEVHPPKVRWAG